MDKGSLALASVNQEVEEGEEEEEEREEEEVRESVTEGRR